LRRQGDLDDHGIVAGVRLPEDLPKIIGHKGQLEEVLINLVRNAIEAMQTNKNDRRMRHTYSGLRTGIWICYTPKISGFVVLFARVEVRIEAIEIAAHGSFFAVLSLSRYVNRSIVGASVHQ
jgi:signal transduction histidine kinase